MKPHLQPLILFTLIFALMLTACQQADSPVSQVVTPTEEILPTEEVLPTEEALPTEEVLPTEEALPTIPTEMAVEEEATPTSEDVQQPISEQVEDLLARMTLAEKIGQMTLVEKGSINARDISELFIGALLSGGGGYPSKNSPEGWAEMVSGFQEQALTTRLGIPLLYGVDAVHGHSNVKGTVIFPHNVGLGAANNAELMERIGQVTALETAATGIYWNYAPAVAVPQDIRWGRTYEGYSENTALVSELSVAYLRGLQGDELSDVTTILATPKHYVGDGGTSWGTSTSSNYKIDQGITEVDEATLRAIHLPPYEAAIEEGAKSIMVSYSSWQEQKMHGQAYLLTDVLKGELGFEGFLVSDWQAIDQIAPDDYYFSVVTSINAGVDMNMVPYDYQRFINTLTDAVEKGDVSLERIDDAVRRILTVKMELGIFERPYPDSSLLSEVGSDKHREVAREAVRQSLVLLKNEQDTLPLAKEAPLIFVAGRAANDIGTQSGGWTIEWQGKSGNITEGTTILEAIESTISPESTVEYNRFGKYDDITDQNGHLAQADIGLVVVGEEPYAEGRGDKADLSLSDADINLIERVRERSKKLVVILISGRPLIITDQLASTDAFVAAWLPGTEGQGVADVLFGDYAFTGKLSYTWPRSMEQVPLPDGEEPLFPFGFGLTTSVK